MLESLVELLENAGRPRVCVVGDVMLDTYVWGGVSRISPEGPIPVVHASKTEHRPGGAGSLAAMLSGLGAEVALVGMVGRDGASEDLRRELESCRISADGLVRSQQRPTTTKTRYLGYVQSAGRALQQLLRVDEEVTDPLSDAEREAVGDAIGRAIPGCNVVVLQDMGKGLFDGKVMREAIRRAREAGVPVVVDPERTEDYAPYENATCVLPNRYEAQLATGLSLEAQQDYHRAAERLLEELALEAVLIKLDREGIYCATADGLRRHVTTQAREVADVTGAGDMVTAAFAVALAAGADYGTAAGLANFCGGLEVSQRGATALPRRQVLEALHEAVDPVARKIVPRERIEQLADSLHQEGRRIAFTNGCFDLLHLGHVQLLSFARHQGDALIVGLNTDGSARRLKGPGRPINSQQVRSHVLAALADVDYVVMFEEQSVLPLIREVRPDVLVKGGDYDKEGVVGHEFVESHGGEVKLAPVAEGFSTTELIRKIAENHERAD